ncbi:MAG TPA: sigma 54-interacting transcriptional regulator [Polyangiaceae bacterium]
MGTGDDTKSRDDRSETPANDTRIFQVMVVAGPSGKSPVVTLDARPVVLGREPEGERTLCLMDDLVSRSHAAIEHDRATGTWSIRDLGSRNGLLVDGRRVTAAPLRSGSVLRIGQTLLVCCEGRLSGGDVLAPETEALRGGGLAMQRVRGEIERVARSHVPVLVVGETGTGKECVAREIHRLSGRTGPFVGVNCAALPEALAESELFGHGVGAFTGASQRSEGLLASAHEGTLLLDEVAELPGAIQAKLLRVLATGEVRPLGSTNARPIDVRVVSASPRDLSSEASFREDLYARLAVWTIRLPPLRERREDVLGLAKAFLAKRPAPPTLSSNAAEALLAYDWPRNVRELEGVLDAAAIRAGDEGVLRCKHLPPALSAVIAERGPAGAAAPPLELLVPPDQVPTASDLRMVLERLEGSVARVARYFGKDRRQVYRWFESAGISPAEYRGGDEPGR